MENSKECTLKPHLVSEWKFDKKVGYYNMSDIQLQIHIHHFNISPTKE